MIQAYEKIESYSGTGIVKIQRVRNNNPGIFMDTLVFRTKYLANNFFIFEWAKDLI